MVLLKYTTSAISQNQQTCAALAASLHIIDETNIIWQNVTKMGYKTFDKNKNMNIIAFFYCTVNLNALSCDRIKIFIKHDGAVI